ncbi:MAG: DNA helicase RecQ [Treponema sp.]
MENLSSAFTKCTPEQVLKKVFGYDSFRGNQKEIIYSLLDKNDTLVIMPTGGGKSFCYQIPALIMEGLTLVVSPLISLMQNQVEALEASGIHCIFLNSSLDWNSYKNSIDEIKKGNVKIVYVSPEGLATSRVRDILLNSRLSLSCIAVDEAHCVSQWGHDFRPDYLEISSIRNLFPDAVMIALTATATENVRSDIIKNLQLKNPAVFISSFNRSNIFLEVQPKKNAVEQVKKFIKKYPGESGIIYCNSRKQVDELTDILDNDGYSVLNYHAGLSDDVRMKNQEKFIKSQVQIMVATIAFGMGIDKPDVRFVINYDLPKSLEEYYQEIGRAGRDGLPATALLLFSAGDIYKVRYFFENSSDDKNAEKLLQGMISYAQSRTCRRAFLLDYFGEKYIPSETDENDCCCDVCKRGELAPADLTVPVQKFLSCMIRTGERYGANYVIDVLMGSTQKRIVENGHNLISTWGIGRDFSKELWLDIVQALVEKNVIYKYGEYNVLKISNLGKALLASREKIFLPVYVPEENQNKDDSSNFENAKTANKTVLHKKTLLSKIEDDAGLLIVENLREWRKKKAQEFSVPPYIIFGDKTLYDIAIKKPKTIQELLTVHGIGETKAKTFGKEILKIIEM